jgi:psp operon transcriptional activator
MTQSMAKSASPTDLPHLIGEARPFVEMLEHVSHLAPLDRPVLVVGERGTGKELVAARLHYLSPRWSRPFVKVNCAALSPELLDSELFGHEAGAFTGAVRRTAGRFERADGGTLFLDEIASASPRVQEKLLRVVEYGEIERVGGAATLTVDVRVVAAANIDLPAAVAAGEFRADLLDRLAFDVVTLPPLRERPEDILGLAQHFAVAMARELGAASFAGFSPVAEEALTRHPWPGNVRELRNAVERAVCRAGRLDRPIERVDVDPFASPFRPLAAAQPAAAAVALPTPPPGREDRPGLLEAVRRLEVGMIEAALEESRHHRGRAAELLGLTYHQLRGYLRRHRIGGR